MQVWRGVVPGGAHLTPSVGVSDVTGVACVSDADPLMRLQAVTAARDLGFTVAGEGGSVDDEHPAVRFVALHGAALCARLMGPGSRCAPLRAEVPRAAPRAAAGAVGATVTHGAGERGSHPLLVAYSAGPPAALAAHWLHGCADLVLELRAVAGRPRLVHPPPRGVVQSAGLSPREADVLLLVLAGHTTPEVAARLCVSAATARSHCRALLRKFGAADRRALRARLLGGAPAHMRPPSPAGPSFAQPRS